MFLCKDCHDETAHREDPMFRSLGRCEGCLKLRVCIDCHRTLCMNPNQQAALEHEFRTRRRPGRQE
jgi:hypothetical protein